MRSLAAKQLAIDHSLCVAQEKNRKKKSGVGKFISEKWQGNVGKFTCLQFISENYLGIV